ncbi:MAG: C40 family peptidase [Chloroflexota bacterium]|nr:C40 family peptidase [Chloroflexota bacterium]
MSELVSILERNGVLSRRRALGLGGALGIGLLTALGTDPDVSAKKKRKQKKKKKSGKKDKKDRKKNKSKSKQKSGKGTGKDIVREAQKHKGTRYVYAGDSPKGFDCSGFTWYVYNKVTGMDITRTVKSQSRQGKSVRNGSWQAGDILIFRNTAGKGLTHCGIYISGDKFIHAENEKTGVVISTFGEGYYKDHYAGARRLV